MTETYCEMCPNPPTHVSEDGVYVCDRHTAPGDKPMTAEWISVEDRLPPKDADVLLLHMLADDPSSIFLGWWGGNWWFECHYYCKAKGGASHEIPGDQITHWMPLPEPPQ